MWVVIKFIRNKFSPPPSLAVHIHLEKKGIGLCRKANKRQQGGLSHDDLVNKDRLLLDPDLTLIDVCYIADYKFEAPLRLSFKFVQFDPTLTSDIQLEASTTPIQQRKPVARNAISSTMSNRSDTFKNSTVDYAKYRVSIFTCWRVDICF